MITLHVLLTSPLNPFHGISVKVVDLPNVPMSRALHSNPHTSLIHLPFHGSYLILSLVSPSHTYFIDGPAQKMLSSSCKTSNACLKVLGLILCGSMQVRRALQPRQLETDHSPWTTIDMSASMITTVSHFPCIHFSLKPWKRPILKTTACLHPQIWSVRLSLC